jgi:ribose/xylose/arabinose/galactoside ABC-type transport system permease subunit
MKYALLLIIVFVWANLQSQPWYSRMYNVTGGHEAAKAMAVSGDSVFIRAAYVCDTTLCTILGVFSQSENDFVDLRQYEGIQLGNKNVMQNDSFIFISF